MAWLRRHVGIDYSDAQTPTASLKGMRVYLPEGGVLPVEVLPPPSPRKYWTRRGITVAGPPKLPAVLPMCFPIAFSGKQRTVDFAT